MNVLERFGGLAGAVAGAVLVRAAAMRKVRERAANPWFSAWENPIWLLSCLDSSHSPLEHRMSDPVVPTADPAAREQGAGCLAIVATYNEIDNLPKLVAELHQELPRMHVLVIDDQSPDGTGNWCDQFAEANSWFQVFHRSGKLGLGSAAVTGFLWALQHDYERVLTMDADLSHCPRQAHRLLDRSLDADVPSIVIGSRYVPGGEIEGWPMTRRWASWCINRFARLWLRLPTRDNSGAFRCYHQSALRTLDPNMIKNQGYGYLEEVLFLARRKQIPLHEVPITFRDRVQGQSKISFREAWSAVATLTSLGLRLRLSGDQRRKGS